MKYTNILSFNWRTIALFVSLFAGMPWLYFAFELVVLNNLLVYMIIRHEGICRKFTAELKRWKNTEIKGIIFDYGGTIDSPRRSLERGNLGRIPRERHHG